MDTIPDYLNPYRIYTSLRIDVPPGFDSIRVGVSDLEKTTPTVKKSLATAEDCSGDEVVYSTPICSGKCCAAAPVRENLTTAESAEKCRVGEPGYPTANGRQVKNGTGIEEIERGGLDLQVGTAEESSEVEALDWFRQELTALYLWAKDPCLVEPLTLYELEHAEAIASYFLAAIQALAKPGTETVPNCGTKPRQSAEWAAKGVTFTTASSHGAPITCQAIQFPGPCTVATPFFEACAWCGPERIGWFSVQFWVRACYGKRKWMSVTQDWKKKVKYCPMCGRKLEVEG